MTPKKSKTLVIQPLQGIGDFMWFIRHLQAIANQVPEKKVTLLTRPRSYANIFIQEDPAVEEVIWLDIKSGVHDGLLGLWRLSRLLKAHKFREAWILHSRSLRYPIACWLAGIPQVHGPGHGAQKYMLTSGASLTQEEQKKHPIERARLFLKHHGISFLPEKVPLKIPKEKLKYIQEQYKKLPKPWICLGISSSEVQKKWPADLFVELGTQLSKKTKGTIFIVGGPAEKKEGLYIQQRLEEKKVKSTLAFGELWESMALLNQSDFIVGNDTGLLHAAPMVGSKGLVLMGKAQVPIHHYAPVEGVRVASGDQVEEGENNMAEILPDLVMTKLKELRWI